MDSFNTLLLTTFAPNERFNNQIGSLRRRLQTLSLVYMTWVCILLVGAFGMIMEFMLHHESSLALILPLFPLLFFNLFLIRSKKLDAAALIFVLVIHFSNKLVGTLLHFPLVSVLGTLVYPYFIFFATSSLKILVLNSLLCCGQFLSNSAKVYEIFQETIDQEPYRQINSFLGICFFVVISVCLISIIQKNMETHIWSVAQENYQKSQQLTQEVISALEAKDTFISTISHELRNPLNSLKGSVDYLAQVVKNQDQLMILRNAKLSGEILLNLVNNILDAAKLKSDKMDIACMDSNLAEIIEKVLNINSQALKDKKIFAQAFIDEALPRALWIDPCRILQILMNLMSNALKFTPCNGKIKIYVAWCSSPQTKLSLLAPVTGGHHHHKDLITGRQTSDSATKDLFAPNSLNETQEMSPLEESNFTKKLESIAKYKIRPSTGGNSHDISFFDPQAETESWKIGVIPFKKYFPCPPVDINSSSSGKPLKDYQNFIKIQIADTGCGIAESDAKKLFGLFEQAAQHSRSVQGGSGLGLWICKQLCQKMHGDITVYSEPKKGSSFVLYIPICNLIAVRRSFDNQGHEPPHTSRKSLRALVVDDFSTNVYAHRLLLEQHDVRVTIASGGQEAVDRYKAQGNDPYHLILMDASMPEMDGFTAAKLIREWEIRNKKRKAALYFVTGEYLDEEVMQEFKRLGGSTQGVNCVRKPLSAETVHQIILSLQ